ncbi:LysR family transcriptional regulator [Shinella yambaruensis]|uniref:LuxR family transcriptional regulator n=1 Tax=Shinella yambaruensis TaxID=415996 RepID=A0ABQ5ZNR6_9HYPH|nr:LysR family transcriptional regulator [Shinella yambaruensis]MCJ8028546.1 LysR family transcriptional regulator [Shinella yambaruensis]MCU7981599.1 LysR family transcriptional regulator [Shinella yambaruensis]GLR53371.1 LuxR family transcriptional regulator [Shinella yambaruensis]
MLDPRLLRAFVAIADAGSFTAAADRLHMTQSTMSQQIARLEEVIGRELVDRAARPVRLTVTGERLLGHARRILALQTEALTLVAETSGTTSVRIGMPDDIATPEMAHAFAAFAKRHKEARLDVTTGLRADLARRYRSGELDIVVLKEDTPSTDSWASFAEPIAWFTALDAPADLPDPVPLVTFPLGGLYRDAMFERLERERRRWYVAFTSASLRNVLMAIEAGLGLSLLPIDAAKGWRVRPFTDFPPEPPIIASLYSWEQNGIVGELANEVLDILRRHFAHERHTAS